MRIDNRNNKCEKMCRFTVRVRAKIVNARCITTHGAVATPRPFSISGKLQKSVPRSGENAVFHTFSKGNVGEMCLSERTKVLVAVEIDINGLCHIDEISFCGCNIFME